MGQNTKVSGFKTIQMYVRVEVYSSGLMVRCMRDSGWMARPMEKADLYMQMVMFMTVIGKMIKHTDSEFTHISTEQDTKATGKKIISTVKA